VAAKAVIDKKTDGKAFKLGIKDGATRFEFNAATSGLYTRSEEHTSELQSP
jgi:hypothetical protein